MMLAWLTNSDSCCFDEIELETIEEIKRWAINRGGSYRLTVDDGRTVDQYRITGNRISYQHSETSNFGPISGS